MTTQKALDQCEYRLRQAIMVWWKNDLFDFHNQWLREEVRKALEHLAADLEAARQEETRCE